MMTAARSRRALLMLLVVPVLISIGFNLYMVGSIRSSLKLTPAGYVSDLYPSWRGTHDLLVHGTNPYSDSQTAEYTRGYYGRTPDDPDIGGGVGYQGFVYPLFLSVMLAPFAMLPFGIVQWLAAAGMLTAIAWTAMRWTRETGWLKHQRDQWLLGILWAGSAPSLYLASLQQLTGLVVGILVLTVVAVLKRRYGWAGALLAAGMFKPQLTLIALTGVALWAWRERCLTRFLRGFAIAAALLVGSSLALMPGWPRWFVAQARAYAATNHLWGMLSVFPAGLARDAAMAAVVLAALAACTLSWAGDDRDQEQFTGGFALLIATTLIVNQGILVYNAVLLIFPLVVILRSCARHRLSWVRLPSTAGLGLLVLSLASGIVGAGLVVAGYGSAAGAVIELMGLGFIAAALPLWAALFALHLSRISWRAISPHNLKMLTRS